MDERQKEYEDMAVSILLDEYTGLDVDQLLKEYDEAEKNGELPPIPEELDRRCRDLVRSQRGEFTNEALTKLLLDIYADMDVDEFIREYEELDDAGELPDIPEEDYRRFLKHAKGNVRKKFIRKAVKVLSSVAAVALMLVGLATVLVMSVDAWRLPVVKFVVEKFDRYSIISVDGPKNVSNEQNSLIDSLDKEISPEYILKHKSIMDDGSFYLCYEDHVGSYIEINKTSSIWALGQDSEDCNAEVLWIDGYNVFWVETTDYMSITWVDEDLNALYKLSASSLSKNVLLDIFTVLTQQ